MTLQLQAVALPSDDLMDWSVRVLVTRDGRPLSGLTKQNFSVYFPWKDGFGGQLNDFDLDPTSFDALGGPGGLSGLDGVYDFRLQAEWGYTGCYFCIVTVECSTTVFQGQAPAPFPHPIVEIDAEQAQAMVSFYIR
jgi:hypothetical protein